jgi:DNA polymerase III alpha subunit (gram-positive type)
MPVNSEQYCCWSRDLCFIDVETTGPVFGLHEIIDLAALRVSVQGLDIQGTWHVKLRPRFPERLTVVAREINGYSEEKWACAQESSPALWESFVEFSAGCVPVCHNPSFDRAFVNLAASRQSVTDLGLDYHWIGTESLCWPLYLKGHLPRLSLDALCDYFAIAPEPKPHTALGGATACYKVYCAMVRA